MSAASAPSLSASVDALNRCSDFILHRSAAQSQPLSLRYDETAAAFALQSTAPLSTLPALLPLFSLRDVFLGKQSPLLSEPAMAALPADCCLTLVTDAAGGMELDLQAASASQVDDWLSGLQAMLQAAGQQVLLTDGDAVQQQLDAALAVMQAGSHFLRLTDGSSETSSILLRYQPPDSAAAGLGCLLFGSASLPLSSLSDVFLGPQAEVFSSMPGVQSECCLSLVWSADSEGDAASLHLVAADEETVNVWLAGINHLLAAVGASDEEGSSGSERRLSRLSVVKQEAEQPQQLKDAEPAELNGADCVQTMTGGSVFTRFTLQADGRLEVDRPLISYDAAAGAGGLGSLRAVSGGNSSVLPLSSLSDVLVGKQTRSFSLPPASSSSPLLSFSLLAEEAQWDLEAESETTLNCWLAGVHHLLTAADGLDMQQLPQPAVAAGGQQPEEPQQPQQRTSAGRGASAAAAVRQSFTVVSKQRPSLSASGAAAASLLSAGDWFMLQRGLGAQRRVFLFLNPASSRLGCFYYTEAADSRQEKVAQSLPLHTLSDVLVGQKALAASGLAAASSTAAACCLSLISKREKSSLHLQAVGGEPAVRRWVRSINSLLQTLGAVVNGKQHKPAVAASAAPAAAAAPAVSSSPSPSPSPSPAQTVSSSGSALSALLPQPLTPSLSAAVSSLSAASAMLLLTAGCESHSVLLQLQASQSSLSLQLSYSSEGMRHKACRRITLRKVTDLYLGLSAPSLPAAASQQLERSIDARRVFSVVTRKQSWTLAAEDERQRATWLAGLRELILAVSNKRLVEETETETEAAATPTAEAAAPASAGGSTRRVSFQAAGASSARASGGGSRSLAALTSGLSFTSYQSVSGLTFKQPILLFYRQLQRRSGAGAAQPPQDLLYWTDRTAGMDRSSPPPLSSACCLPVDRIADVYLGKQTPLLLSKAAAAADEERCISLLAADTNAGLELEADDKETVELLLAAVQFVCRDGGRSVKEEEPEPAAPCEDSKTEEEKEKLARSQQLAMLTRKRGLKAHKRFSLGPASQAAAANRRLSSLNTRLSMLATQEDDSFPLPAGFTLAGVLQAARLVAGDGADGCLRMMEEGRCFTGYTADSRGRYHQSTLLLFLSRSPAAAVCWCPYGVRQQHPNASLPLSSLTAVSLGKRTAALQSALAAAARDDRCLSLQAAERSIDLQARDEKTLLGWLLGLAAIMLSIGKELQGTAGEAGAQQPWGRTLLVSAAAAQPPASPPLPPPPPPPASPPQPTSTAFDVITVSDDGSVSRASVLVSISADSLVFSSPSASSECRQPPFPLRSLRDIYCGKMTAGMRHSALLELPESRCLSLVSRSAELNLLGRSAAEVSAFVHRLMAALKGSGKQVQDEKQTATAAAAKAQPPPLPSRPQLRLLQEAKEIEREPAAAGSKRPPVAASASASAASSSGSKENSVRSSHSRRLSVLPPPSQRLPRTAQQLVLDSAARRQSLLRLSPQQSIQMMAEGRRFRDWTAAAAVTARLVSVFYVSGCHALFKSQPGSRTQSAEASLPLAALTEVLLGKQSSVLLSSACSALDRARCISLITADGSWHLEADSAQQLASWLFGLQALLSQQGKTCVVETKTPAVDEAGRAAAGAGRGGRAAAAGERRFSVVNRVDKAVKGSTSGVTAGSRAQQQPR